MNEEIILEEIEEESPLRKFIRKVVIRTMAIILILLFASYLLAFYALNYFESRSESTLLDQSSFSFDVGEYSVQFEEEVYNQLHKIYFANREHEFKACLFGTVEDNLYTITKVVEPKIFSQSPFHVSAEPCAPEAIVDIHSHPFQRCIASAQDISYLSRLKQVNPVALMGVMCEQFRISFYS